MDIGQSLGTISASISNIATNGLPLEHKVVIPPMTVVYVVAIVILSALAIRLISRRAA